MINTVWHYILSLVYLMTPPYRHPGAVRAAGRACHQRTLQAASVHRECLPRVRRAVAGLAHGARAQAGGARHRAALVQQRGAALRGQRACCQEGAQVKYKR